MEESEPDPRPDVTRIPEELKAIPHWVCWRKDPPRKQGAKPVKVPIDAKTGANGSSTDAATWSSLDAALRRMEADGLAGVGFVLTTAVGLVVLDLDRCVDARTGEVEPWAVKLVERLGSYVEVSPSGTGLHIWIRAELPPGHNRKGNFEVYANGRYMTVTGARFDDRFKTIESRTEIMAKVFAEVFGTSAPERQVDVSRTPKLELDDDALLERALAASNGDKLGPLFRGDHSAYKSQSEADLALCGILAFWCAGEASRVDRLFRTSGLMRPKWDEQHGKSTYGQRTITLALAGKTKFYDPTKPKVHRRALMPQWTDSANAELFAELSKGDLRYCAPMKTWFVWSGSVWNQDSTGAALLHGKAVVEELDSRAKKIKDPKDQENAKKWVRKSASVERRRAMPALAGAEIACAIEPDKFDRDSWLLNLRNGTLDLRTLKLSPHRREDFITKISPANFDVSAKAPQWCAFLERVLPDSETREFTRRWLGVSLTGEQGDQAILFLLGDGSNGKSTLLRVIQGVHGTHYAINASSELLTKKRERGHPTEYADLAGVRLAICSETNAGEALDEALIKRLTGGERIRARRMKQDFWEFDPTHHLVVATNHMPQVRGRKLAIWRRLLIVRFSVTISDVERDIGLVERILAEERDGVLHWMLEGLADWKMRGNRLHPPSSVIAETRNLQAESDIVGRFVRETCVRVQGARTGASELYSRFLEWCQTAGAVPESQRAFGQSMRAIGFVSIKSGGVNLYVDVRLNRPPDPRNGGEGGSGTFRGLHASDFDRQYGVEPEEGPRSSPSDAKELTAWPGTAGVQGRAPRDRAQGGAPVDVNDVDDHGHSGRGPRASRSAESAVVDPTSTFNASEGAPGRGQP